MIGEQRRSGHGASWRALEAMVPAHHILSRVDRLLDLGELRDALAPFYSGKSRPSIAPELLIRMALIGRLYGITSERHLCKEVRFNLAYRRFCRLPLDAPIPHHSTFSKNWHGRFRDAGIFLILFEQTVRRCAEAGLIARKDAAVDARSSRPTRVGSKMRDTNLAASRLARSVQEWRADQANAPPQEQGVPRGKPAEVSCTDPASAWSARAARGRFGYAFNVLIDTPGGVTIDVEASPAGIAAEVDAGRTMLARAADRFGYWHKRCAADTTYGSAAFLAFVTDRGTVPHIPVLERSEQNKGKFPREAFRYEREQDRHICPAGKALAHRGADRRASYIRYGASPIDCRACHLKRKSTGSSSRSVAHSDREDVHELVRGEMQTPLFK